LTYVNEYVQFQGLAKSALARQPSGPQMSEQCPDLYDRRRSLKIWSSSLRHFAGWRRERASGGSHAGRTTSTLEEPNVTKPAHSGRDLFATQISETKQLASAISSLSASGDPPFQRQKIVKW